MSDGDRMSEGYEPDWDLDAEVGSQGELFTWNVIGALKEGSSESKNDMRSLFTGNVYIECECLRRGQWGPSGIMTTRASVWCHVLGTGLLIAASTDDVRRVVAKYQDKPSAFREMPRGSHPTRGVVIPVPVLVQEVRVILRRRYGN